VLQLVLDSVGNIGSIVTNNCEVETLKENKSKCANILYNLLKNIRDYQPMYNIGEIKITSQQVEGFVNVISQKMKLMWSNDTAQKLAEVCGSDEA